jgi:hypothetical protein
MKMDYRIPLFLLTSLPLMPACIQELDTGADRESKATLATPPPPPREHPSIIPFEAEPPLVTPLDGTPVSTETECEAHELLAMDTLKASCATCHDGAGGVMVQGSFSTVLDIEALTSTEPVGPQFAGMGLKYITPGDPRKSLIFIRIANGTMPQAPMDVTNIEAANYRWPLNASDASLIYTWIKDCL